MKKWLCIVCGVIYDEAEGWPQDGIPPGTRWEDVPEDWKCPECGVGKADFEMLEIAGEEVPSASPAIAVSAVAAANPVTQCSPHPVVIVGSGHAGYGLAQAIRQRDPHAEIIVLTRESGHLYSKPALSIATSLGRSVESLIAESPFEIERRLRIRVYPYCDVHAINSASHTLTTSMGEMPYAKLVLALGASPVRLGVRGRGDALLSVNNLDDYRALRRQLEGATRVAIIGDGLIGCEFANDLATSGYQVSVVGIGRWPLERLLPHAAGVHLQRALTSLGVDWHLENQLEEIGGVPGAWQLKLADGRELEANVVISAVGLTPNVALAADSGCAVGRGIRTDDTLQTSLPDVYALGDCLEIGGRLAPYLAPINHGITALARTLTGSPTPVSYPPMPVHVKTPVAPLCFLPSPASGLGEWRVDETADGGVSCGHFDDSGRMCGFALVGSAAQSLRGQWLEACKPPIGDYVS